jgi:hypothetical protein
MDRVNKKAEDPTEKGKHEGIIGGDETVIDDNVEEDDVP